MSLSLSKIDRLIEREDLTMLSVNQTVECGMEMNSGLERIWKEVVIE
jgi:hypothetical protein